MRKYIILLIGFVFNLNALGQTLPVFENPTPDVFSFEKNINIPVSLYTGIPSISIPIYTINSGNITIPVALNYNAQGIRVNEIATRYGLGWDLEAGGAIVREVKSKIDEYNYLKAGSQGYLNFVGMTEDPQRIADFIDNHTDYDEMKDLEPDLFSFHFAGYSGKFFFDQATKKPILQSFNDLKIEVFGLTAQNSEIEGFVITDPKGVQYYFGRNSTNTKQSTQKSETSYTEFYQFFNDTDTGTAAGLYTGGTSGGLATVKWDLMEIKDTNNVTVVFEYDLEQLNYKKRLYDGFLNPTFRDENGNPNKRRVSMYGNVTGTQKFLRKIIFKDGEIEFVSSATPRLDMGRPETLHSFSPKYIEQIKIKNNTEVIKKYNLTFEYVENNDVSNTLLYYHNESKKRLFLKAVQQVSDNQSIPPYQFVYSDVLLPNRFSNSIDWWGFYNGKQNGDTYDLFCKRNDLSSVTDYLYNGGREVDEEFNQAGLLKKVIYPSGGEAEYEYESNQCISPYFMKNSLNFFRNPSTIRSIDFKEIEEYRVSSPGAHWSQTVYETPQFLLKSRDFAPLQEETVHIYGSNKTSPGVGLGGPNIERAFNIQIICDSLYQSFSSPPPPIALNDELDFDFLKNLPSGYYRIRAQRIIPKESLLPDFAVALNWKEEVIGSNQIMYVGGNRIRKTILRDASGHEMIKKYAYHSFDVPGSSGTLFGFPDMYVDLGTVGSAFIMGAPINAIYSSPTNHAGYSNVTEYTEGGDTEYKTEYTFTTHPNEGNFFTYPLIPQTDYEWIRGKPLSVKYYKGEPNSTSFTLSKEVVTDYNYPPFLGVNWVEPTSSPILMTPETMPKPYTNTFSSYYLSFPSSGDKYFGISGGIINVKSTIEKDYLGGNVIVKSTYYDYEGVNHHQLTTQTEVISQADSLTTKYYYPPDASMSAKPVVAQLKAKNMIGIPLVTETYRNTEKLSTQETVYKNWGTTNNPLLLPELAKTSKGSGDLEIRLRYQAYDSQGNLTQVRTEQGLITSYIWGYNKTLPIAKLDNMTNAAVATATGIAFNDLNESHMATINSIRTNGAYSNGQITTLTYKPLVGVTSVTDPRGDRISYGYDEFNRLQWIKDRDNNFLSETDYHYRQNSSDQNYIKTKAYKTATTTSIGTPSAAQATQSVTYFDGLGRPIQQIAHKQAGNGNDLVTHIEYDGFGRQTKEYLPVVNGQTLDYHTLDANSVLSYYSSPPSTVEATTNPYSEKLFEASPLNRVLEQAAPGNDWALNNTQKHTIRFDYQTNAADEVKLFKATATWSGSKGLYDIALTQNGTTFYGANQLYKTITKDENWEVRDGDKHTTQEFKDKEGRVVLKRTYGVSVINDVETAAWHETYYVYDQFGNLTYVIPPLVEGTINEDKLNGLCYQYKYDHRNRLVEKKLPGKQWEFIVYDKLDRVVMSGPALSPFTSPTGNGWMITKYDVYSRPILTAWLPGTTTAESRKTYQDGYNSMNSAISEAKMVPTATVNGVTFHYSNVIAPTADYHVLTINYYDTYNVTGITFSPSISYSAIHGQTLHSTTLGNWPMGLPTVSWVRVPETTNDYKHEKSYTLYDQKGRAVRTAKFNYLGGYTQTDQKLQPITGRVDFTETKHKRLSSDSELYVKDTYTYTDQDRLLTHTHQIGTGGAPQLLAKNEYDELGQLISKDVGGTDVTTYVGLQKVDYSYNIRGWLKSINDINDLTTDNDLFAFKLSYNSGATPLYNGNISETYWLSSNDNNLRKYEYHYDSLNRLLEANYKKPNSSATANSYMEKLSYDKNGNIQFLQRNGDLDADVFAIEIDDLTYTYHPDKPNQLMKVLDSSNHPEGFKDDSNGITDTEDDYVYDDFGNLKKDQNKQITSIIYNHLNLPTSIQFADGRNIIYLYNAVGQKVKKVVQRRPNVLNFVKTDYMDGFQYTDDILRFFPHAEGYVNAIKNQNGSLEFNYVYQYKDHLGNVRLSFAENPSPDIENPSLVTILEENHYYPFGLKHTSYNTSLYDFVEVEDGNDYYINLAPVSGDNLAYKYRYNGQEWQNELGLNMTAMDYRQYDNALGRFNGMDALAELMPSITPYHFGFNNPVYWGDPTGLKPATTSEMIKTAWDNTAEGTNSYWVNDGFGNFDNANGSGFISSSGEFFGYSESLPGVTIISQRGYRKDESFIGQLRAHIYSKGKYYQGFRDRAFSKQVDELQSGLDWLGTAEPIGIIDGLNAAIYLARGQKANAAIAAVAILPFGDVGKFAKIQKHHIIPRAVFRDADVAVKNAMDLNAGKNLKKLPSGFHGNHPQYSSYVAGQLNALDNVTPGSIQTLQKRLNGMINDAYDNYKVTGENLNDYFRKINGN